jgi:hypothetical protein
MRISFLIPFRDSDGTRTAGHQWLLRRWQHFYPEAEFCIAPDDGLDPFNKSLAVNNAAKLATGDTFVVLDADTWVAPRSPKDRDPMEEAFERIANGIPWVIPVHQNFRLKQEPSKAIMQGDPTAPFPPVHMSMIETRGPVVGFCHVMPRAAFEAVGGYDERIRGWGGEDTSFTWAMDIVNGKHRKLHGIAVCLWHARPRDHRKNRIWIGQDRTLEQDKKRVVGTYTAALRQSTSTSRREAMLKALER